MILTFKASRKIWTLQLVTRRVWGEMSVWGTRGVHGPWKFSAVGPKWKPVHFGFRLVHPWGGAGYCLDWRER